MTIELLEDTIVATADYSETNLDTGGSTVPTSGCSLDCTPETVDVDIINNTYEIDSVGLVLAMVQDSPTQVTVTVTADIEDWVNLDMHFVDNPAVPDQKTVSPPDTPGWISAEIATSALGVKTLVISHTGATDTWYLVLKGLNGVLIISEAITIGV